MDRQTKSCLLWIAVAIAVPVLLAGGAWVYLDIKWSRELEARLAPLQQQGKPLTYAAIAPAPVPDDQNAAIVYQTVFNVQFAPGTRAPNGMAGLSEQELDWVHEYLKSPDGLLEAKVRQMLSRTETHEALQVLRRASRMPDCVFPVNWQDGPGALFPHLAKFRRAAQLVSAHALLLAKDGEVDDALGWSEVSLRMAEHAAVDPSLIGQLVSIAIAGITANSLRQWLPEADPSPATLEAFEQYLRQMDLDKPFVAAFEGERAMAFGVSQDPQGPGALPRPLRTRAQALTLHHWEEQIEAVKLPYRLAAPELDELERRTAQFEGSYLSVLMPAYGKSAMKRDAAKAQIALLRVVLALKGHKHRHGSCPASLAELQQTLDWDLPKDPFSGRDFVYQRQDDGFELYSVGPNLRDDLGLPEWDAAGNYREDADIVWVCVK